jgi:cytochrome c biogenesis protein CcdA/thiol-disulfide isomerase/thioredoxin
VILLLLFALLAGFATCLSPCVLPVLPAVLAGGTTGGRRRPLGIVTGIVISFTFATIALVYLIAALGLPNDLVRTLAIAILLVFGLLLLFPTFSARLEAWLSGWAPAPHDPSASGFLSGLPLGFGLGFLYAPCAGPILAGVITVSAAQTFTAGRLAVALAYAIGSALALYVIMLGGRRLAGRLVARSVRVQQALGALMIVVAVLVSQDVDIRFQTAVAAELPGFLSAPADELQESGAVGETLAAITGHASVAQGFGLEEAKSGKRLPVVGPAPEFTDTQEWFNTADARPLSMAELGDRGRVVLIDFWTYTCINCIRTFPHLRALDAKYREQGLTIVGVHTPEFPFEKDPGNVADAIEQNQLAYPVVQDNDYGTWDAYRNAYWPADYPIDAEGRIRYVHFGEGDYEATESAVRSLLAEAGRPGLGGMTDARIERAAKGVATPETYLGAARARGFVSGPILPGAQDFGPLTSDLELPRNGFAYGGRWTIENEAATAGPEAELAVSFEARRVFLVMGSPEHPREVEVLLDGKPIAQALAGDDVHDGKAAVGPQRLYRLVDLPRVEQHQLTLRFEAGVSGYAFTFG